MSAQIIQFPRAEKASVAFNALDDQIDGLLVELMPRLNALSRSCDEFDERLHRFWVKRGLVTEADH